MQLGPVRFTVNAKTQASQRPFEHRLIVRETSFRPPTTTADGGIQELYGALARDETRNVLILNDVIAALEDGRSPILLTERRDHLEYFARKLRPFARHLVVLQGGMGAKAPATYVTNSRRFLPRRSGSCSPPAGTSARGSTTRGSTRSSWRCPSRGRGPSSSTPGDSIAYIPASATSASSTTSTAKCRCCLRMFEKRLRGYRAIGYARGEAPLGYAEPAEESTVEYDEDVLAELDQSDDFA